MIKAILADDEPIIIKGLKKLIPWEEQGIQIIGEAWTGRSLMELIERERPALVITDISMPDGTGIEVLKEIGRRGFKTKVIFISAYQEFSYAKDALALGAVDYLVKPIEKELLFAAVGKALMALNDETEEIQFKNKLAAYEQKDRKTRLEELFDRLLEGDIRKEEAEEKLTGMDTGWVQSCYTVMLLEPELPLGDNRWGEHEKRLLLFAVGNMVEELIRREFRGLLLRKGDLLCAVLNHHPGADMRIFALEMVQNTGRYLKIDLSVGIGQTSSGIEGIKDSYRTASGALDRIFFSRGCRVELWTPVIREERVTERDLGEARHECLQACLSKEPKRLEEGLAVIFDRIERFSEGSQDKAVTASYGTIVEWAEALEDVGVQLDKTDVELSHHLSALQSFNRYEELKNYVQAIATQLLRRLESGTSGKETQQLLAVKEYIESHYMENITLEGAASRIYMNPYYFSSFFKKHTQMNFKQYLTEVRMKQAMKLLLGSDLMIYEIAERVGYNNARQFSDMFKKFYGKLPQEYKTHN